MSVQANRILYSSQSVGIAPFATPAAYMTLRGIQTVGVNTKFNLEEVFEMGNLPVYEQVENIPEIEVTMEKHLDGYTPIYCLATSGAPSATLIGRSNQRANIAIGIYNDLVSMASGTPLQQCVISGAYISQVAYNMSVQGFFAENVTFVANSKIWSSTTTPFNGFTSAGGVVSLAPAAPEGVNRRQNFNWAGSLLPLDIPGVSSSGTNDPVTTGVFAGQYNVSVQSIKVTANLGREELLELGRRVPYFRYVKFPVQVNTSIDCISKGGDLVSATDVGIYANGFNTTPRTIRFKDTEGLAIDLGSKNVMNGVTMSGNNASAQGGNQTIAFNYQTFNDFTVMHAADPSGFVPTF